MKMINLDENQQEFVANSALVFDGIIAEGKVDIDEISQILSFLISLYGINAPLDESEKVILRQAYKIIQKKFNQNRGK